MIPIFGIILFPSVWTVSTGCDWPMKIAPVSLSGVGVAGFGALGALRAAAG
jgi:hypothetical protein